MHLATRIDGLVAVIGDIHGQVDKLRVVLEKLRKRSNYDDRWIVFLGDFVDRGPDPRATLDLVTALLAEHPKTTAVAGNHDVAMSAALGLIPVPESSTWTSDWLEHYGAETTFTSYGAEWRNLEELRAHLPEQHGQFLANLPWLVEHPQYLFVHAGIDPNMSYEIQLGILRQREFSLNWPPWLCSRELAQGKSSSTWPRTVVSGHVCIGRIEFRHKRILMDTSGGTDGQLSCVLLPEKQIISSGEAAILDTGRPWWKFWG